MRDQSPVSRPQSPADFALPPPPKGYGGPDVALREVGAGFVEPRRSEAKAGCRQPEQPTHGVIKSSKETPSLTVPVELRVDDVVRTHVWTLLQLPGTRLLLGVSALLSLGLVLLLVRALLRGVGVVVPVAAVVALLVTGAVVASRVRRGAREHFEALSDSERVGSYTLTPDGFSWTLGRSPGNLPWTAVMRCEDTEEYLFLLTPGARSHVVPKRLLSQEQRRELKTYVDAMTGA